MWKFSFMIRHGFNLIEMLVVIAILSFLTVLAIPLTEITHQRTAERQMRERLGEMRSAIDAYRRAHAQGGLPPCVASLLEPLPTNLLRPNGNNGPFLATGSLGNPFSIPPDQFLWDLRLYNPTCPSPSTWQTNQKDPVQTFGAGTGVFDLRFPGAGISGLATSPIDGTRYALW